ncbi:hypothetical protein BDR07DRAFT_1485504 [Suillus spraguei]|nr:hypothetical protein BDR07DRAFT_1485504 [Suillus spraguei]
MGSRRFPKITAVTNILALGLKPHILTLVSHLQEITLMAILPRLAVPAASHTYRTPYFTNWDGVTSDSEKTQTVCWEVLQCPKEDKVKVQGTRSEYDQGFSLEDRSKRFLRE